MEKSLIIIGAGVAGLAAGCYARMNGYTTTILEMGETPGGLCTSWNRSGYMFDGSVAGIAGSGQGSPLYSLWEEIGVLKYCPLFYGENFGYIQLPNGKIVTVYTNIDKLKAHLLENFPTDVKVIDELTEALYSVIDLDIPFTDGQGWESLKSKAIALKSSISHLPALLKYGTMPISEFVAKANDPLLATVLHNIVHFGGDDVPLLTVLLPLAYAHRKMAGIPLHGWLSFATSIEKRFFELGGEIKYREKVSEILIDNSVVKGVMTESGSRFFADRVLSAADGRSSESIFLRKPFSETWHSFDQKQLSEQPVQVNIGVAYDFSSLKGPLTIMLSDAFDVAGVKQNKITIHNKFYDQSAAPKGKSAITVFLKSNYNWWKNLESGTDVYHNEKKRCADIVIDTIDQYYPGFQACIEVIDVSTPLTRERYTGNWMGAMQARKPNSNMIKALVQGSPKYAYKGIKGYYMAGQWVEPWGGITTAAQSSRKAIQLVCRRDGIKFVAKKT